MAHADFIEFLSRLAKDDALRKRIETIGGSTDGAVEHLIGIAAEEGLSFTESEIDELFLAHAAAVDGELSLEQLERAAGGTTALTDSSMEVQELSTSFDIQYQQLALQMQESRSYTTISNIMKTKHDTAKNAINNVR